MAQFGENPGRMPVYGRSALPICSTRPRSAKYPHALSFLPRLPARRAVSMVFLAMQSGLGTFAAVAMAFALLCQSAEAGPFKRKKNDPRLTVLGIAVGAGMTAAYFGLRDWRWKGSNNAKVSSGGAAVITTVGCMALSPIVGTIVVQRELTMREAYVMTADCIVPFVGGWLMGKAFDNHPEWEAMRPRRR
jgi:hypothetical protein